MAATVTVNDVLDGHVALDIECLDRIYLNGYVPTLQTGGAVVSFLTAHLDYEIPSPAIFEKIGTAFRRAVASFAEDNHIPVVRFGKNDRQREVTRMHLGRVATMDRGEAGPFGALPLALEVVGDGLQVAGRAYDDAHRHIDVEDLAQQVAKYQRGQRVSA